MTIGPERRRQRAVVYGVIFLIIAVAFGFGLASVIADTRDRTAETLASPNPEPQGQAVAAISQNGDANADGGAIAGSVDNSNLEGRDAELAVDPNRTDWNYESSGRKTMYLTIDDGPSENTQAVLDVLDRYNCKATFFVVGHNDEYFPLIAEAYRRGHSIGLHSMTHDYASVYSSLDAYYDDLNQIAQVVKDQIGFVPYLIRFPGGSSNMVSAEYTPGIMTELVSGVQELGYQYYDWNVSSGDGADHSTEELISFSCEPTEEENIVFLCHDSATKQTTVEALPAIIEHYQSLGYSFEALDRSCWVCHHGVNN